MKKTENQIIEIIEEMKKKDSYELCFSEEDMIFTTYGRTIQISHNSNAFLATH
jgi:hypothetical protein